VKGGARASLAISGAGALALSAIIWFAGSHFGMSTAARAWVSIGILLLWIVAALVGRVIATRRGRGIEDALRGQADEAVMDASAAQRGEVAQIRSRLLAAISTLKSSRLGRGALYELPWYMMIGHTAAGKSTALLQSGLTFPFAEQGVPGCVQGVGGTRNCDWFLSTEGILLDTAGRYATGAAAGDRDEWIAFLKLLRRYRPRAPINGVLVATSLPELAGYRLDTFATYARHIRERVSEIEDAFGMRVPVYLIFTKLDLLGGFSQFFGGMDAEARGRVWGATLPHDLSEGFDIRHEAMRQCELLYRGLSQMGDENLALSRGTGGRPAHFAFPLEFHEIKEAVGHLAGLLHEEDPYHSKPMLRGFYFTSAIQSGEPGIAAGKRVSSRFGLSGGGFAPEKQTASDSYFLSGLFRDVVFPDQYLAQRQGSPRASRLRLATMMAGTGALAVCVAALSQSWMANRSMLSTLLADRTLAAEMSVKDSIADKLGGLAVLQKHLEVLQKRHAEGIHWEMGMGLYQGRRLEAALRKQYYTGIQAVLLAPLKEQLEGRLLELVRNPPMPAQAPEQSTAATPGGGTGRNGSAHPDAPPMPPVLIFMPLSVQPPPLPPSPTPQTAHRPPTDPEAKKRADEGYDALKTYLMLTDEYSSSHLDTGYLATTIPRFWHPWLKAQDGGDAAEADALKAAYFYVAQLDARAPELPHIKNNSLAVDEARLVLKNVGTPRPIGPERIYLSLKEQASARFPALDAARILGGRDADILGGNATVPGAFTRDAYEKFMRGAIADASHSQAKNDDWVLATSEGEYPGQEATSERASREIEALYRAEYADAWMHFLRGLECTARPGSIADAVRILERLSDPQHSPLKAVLQRASFETSWDNPPAQLADAAAAAQSAAQSAVSVRTGGRATLSASALPRYGELGQQFAAIHAFSGSGGDAAPALAAYLERLALVGGQIRPTSVGSDPDIAARKLIVATLDGNGSELAATLQYVDGKLLISVQEQTFRDILRPLLVAPLTQSYAALLPSVEQALNEAWREEVLTDWQALSGKYPFAHSQNEARVGEILQFTGSNGTLARFISERLGGLATRHGSQIAPRTWAGLGVRLDPQFAPSATRLLALGREMTRASGGEPSSFRLRPVPNPALTEYVIEIDGQRRTYRNGPQEWWTFVWPKGDSLGASVRATGISGEPATVSSHAGRMGLVRLLDRATRTLDAGRATGQLEWRFQGRNGSQSVKVDFQMSGGANPMFLSGLAGISLPGRVAQQGTAQQDTGDDGNADQFLAIP
jgi:type VI secretion system protein ImpL